MKKNEKKKWKFGAYVSRGPFVVVPVPIPCRRRRCWACGGDGSVAIVVVVVVVEPVVVVVDVDDDDVVVCYWRRNDALEDKSHDMLGISTEFNRDAWRSTLAGGKMLHYSQPSRNKMATTIKSNRTRMMMTIGARDATTSRAPTWSFFFFLFFVITLLKTCLQIGYEWVRLLPRHDDGCPLSIGGIYFILFDDQRAWKSPNDGLYVVWGLDMPFFLSFFCQL